MYGSQRGLNQGRRVGSKGDLTGGGSQYYSQSEIVQGGGNGYDPYMDGYTYTITKSSSSGMADGMMNARGGRVGYEFILNLIASALCWLSPVAFLCEPKGYFCCALFREYSCQSEKLLLNIHHKRRFYPSIHFGPAQPESLSQKALAFADHAPNLSSKCKVTFTWKKNFSSANFPA